MFKAYKASMRERYRDPATRRYVLRVLVAMALYAVLLSAVQRLAPSDLMHGDARYIVAVLPGAPIAAVFWLIGRYITQMRDEFQRLLEVRKAMIATGITMTGATLWGFEEMLAGAPHLPTFFIPAVWFGSLAIGEGANRFLEWRRA